MLDVDKIIDDYQQALEKKELERLAELSRARQIRIINAEAIEGRIREVIEPAFEGVKKQLMDKGFQCEVEITSKKDSKFHDAEKMFALVVTILTTKKRNAHSGVDYSKLQYEGNFDSQEITKSVFICDLGKPADIHPPMALSRVDSDLVAHDLEIFLKKVFSV